MKHILWLCIPVLLVVGILEAAFELRAEIVSDRAFARISEFRAQLRAQERSGPLGSRTRGATVEGIVTEGAGLNEGEEDGRLRALQSEEKDVLEVARHATSVTFAPSRAHSSYASLLRHLAESRVDEMSRRGLSPEARVKEQLALFCEALSSYGAALAIEPLNARLLMSWANVRQILGPTECGLPLTTGDFAAAVVQAMKLDPTDVQSKYAAALLLLWGRNTEQAWRLMREVLRFNTELSETQRKGILSQVQSVVSLRAIVPARFPQIVFVSEYLAENPLTFGGNEAKRADFELALAAIQREAIENSVEEYARDGVPYSVHTERLIQLSDVAADDAVRQRLDGEIAALVRRRGQFALADYLSERASAEELGVVIATMAGDTRPSKSPIVRWGDAGKVYFDEFYRSIGIFLSKGQAARGIEFEVQTLPNSSFASSLKTFTSEDNQNWTEITSHTSVKAFEIGQRVLVTIRFPPRDGRYWKVHFSSANRERNLLGRIPQGVKVYGASVVRRAKR